MSSPASAATQAHVTRVCLRLGSARSLLLLAAPLSLAAALSTSRICRAHSLTQQRVTHVSAAIIETLLNTEHVLHPSPE